MLKKLALFAFVFAGVCAAATFTTVNGKLSVSGGKILNQSGNVFVLRGMSFYWYNGPWTGGQPGNQFYTSANVSALADNWGANVVRAAIGNVQQNPSDALSMAKSMIQWAYNAKIYVIIDNHSHIAHRSGHNTAAQNFFRDVSAYVKQNGYTHVIYEIYNEPVCDWDQPNNTDCQSTPITTWDQIKSYAETVINVIRQNDADGLIIVGTPSFSSGINAARGNPISGKNLLYTLHFYAGQSAHGNYRSSVRTSYCNDFPIFVSEWGTSQASGSGTISTSSSDTWISLLEAAKISHANWSLVNNGQTSAALTSTSVTGGLTESGTYVKNLLRLNTGATLSQVGLTDEPITCASPISTKELAVSSGHWNFDVATNSFVFDKNEGSLAIYNLQGERLRLFAVQGSISLNGLPSGTYIAVYKQGSETGNKVIFLK